MKGIIGLIVLLGFVITLRGNHTISGFGIRTDTGEVMIGGWGPGGFPPELPFGWNIFTGEYTGQVPDGWSGTITPHSSSMQGTFSPASITYNNVTTELSNQNFAFTPVLRTISGYVLRAGNSQGVSGVYFSGLPAMTNASGFYSGTVPLGWSGTVTPHCDQVGAFAPTSLSYTDITTDMANQNYVWNPVVFSISGRVTKTSDGLGSAGIILNGLPGNPVTDSTGFYTAEVASGYGGLVTPSCTVVGIFAPANRFYQNVTADYTEQNYTYTPITYTVSGRITNSNTGQGVPEATLNGFPENTVTDAAGYYTALVPYGFSGVITPSGSQTGSFSPNNRTYQNVHANQANQNYTWSVTSNEDNLQPVVLLRMYPNPFKDKVIITIQSGKKTLNRMDIFNIRGEKVKSLRWDVSQGDEQEAIWDGRSEAGIQCSSGVYFIRLATDKATPLRKLLFLP